MKKMFRFGFIGVVLTFLMVVMPLQAFAAETDTLFDGKISIIHDGGSTFSPKYSTGDGNETQYTATVEGSSWLSRSGKITIKNTGERKANIELDYVAVNCTSFSIGNTETTSGKYLVFLEAEGSFTIEFEAAKKTTATVTLTNIKYTEQATSSDVTFEFDSSLGSVTVGGNSITSGYAQTVEASAPVEISATPASGAFFVGWIDGNNKIISTNTTHSLQPLQNMTVRALFRTNDGTPYFMVDSVYIFNNLNDAVRAGNNIVLMCDGVLSGEYTISAGQTLLIPFDDANTMYDKSKFPEGVQSTVKAGDISAYRTLTLAGDAKITVNGVLNASANQSSSTGTTGLPIGKYGHIKMESGSSITVNSGGTLYAWGYITGSGSITAKLGATVYENFQVEDWRGGDATSQMASNTFGVFPMSQYYVQNIEVPLTLEAGATENGYMTVYVTLAGIQGCVVPFIGPDGMFNVTEGSITKDYNEGTDRLIININEGNLQMKSLELSMKLALLGSTTINSLNFNLPVNGNITLNVNKGSTVNITQDIALLPGAVIDIAEGAFCKFGKKSNGDPSKAFIYDSEDWGGYCSQYNLRFEPLTNAPGRENTRKEKDLHDAEIKIAGTIDAMEGFVYTTTDKGANIHGVEGAVVKLKPGADTVTYQAVQDSETPIKYQSIDVTTAYLKNDIKQNLDADLFVDPEYLMNCCTTYEYKGGVWKPQNVAHTGLTTVEAKAATCTEKGWDAYEYCTACNYNTMVEIAALGHDEVSHDAQAATCTETGWEAYVACTRCDYSTKVEIPALGHNEVSHEGKAATCTEKGWKAYETCTRCDYTTYAEIAALGHDEVAHEGKAATCTEKGWNAYETCTRCDYTTYAEIAALGHDEVSHDAQAATCTETGWEAYETCTRCDYSTKVEIPALGHNEVSHEGKAATCTEKGWKAYETCTRCDYSTKEIIPEQGHDILNHSAKEPTCEEAGWHDYRTCSRCDYSTYEEIPAIGHNYGDWIEHDAGNHKKVCANNSEHIIIEDHTFEHLICMGCGCEKRVTSTKYSIVDGNIELNTSLLLDVEDDAYVITATYDSDGKIHKVALSKVSEIEKVTLPSADVAKVKVFVWSDLILMKPISFAEEIAIN